MKNINDIQVIQYVGSLDKISALMHKSYVSKISKNNSIYLDQKLRSWHLYIYTRDISPALHNLRNVIITYQTMNDAHGLYI